jgi:thioester reductase-like protein
MFEAAAHAEHVGMAHSPILLTGATGFLGMELLARYLERTDRQVYALVRARDDAEAEMRLRQTVGRVLPDPTSYADRVVAVRGDVTRAGLGMGPRRRAELAATVGEIVHAAASVSFTLPTARARAINVEGTRQVLGLAQLAARRGDGLRRLSYISTAYVAGDHSGTFGEDDLDVRQSFRNPYEQSKFEAEQLVRAHMQLLPIQVFRPSIVVGEEDTGWTPAFNVIYWPLRAFARGAYRAIPARRSSPVDVVSVSYVADAIFELAQIEDVAGETYNLAAGGGAATVGELLDLGAEYFDRRAPVSVPPAPYKHLVHPLLVRRAQPRRRAALEQSEVFFPYFAMGVRYDTTRAAARLEGSGVRVRPLADYFKRLMDYAVATDWGRYRPRRRDRAFDLASVVPE